MAIGMLEDQKKLAQLIIGSKNAEGKEELEEGPEVEQDDDIAMDAVASKIMTAFEKKDKKALIEGLKDFMSMIQVQDEMQDQMTVGMQG